MPLPAEPPPPAVKAAFLDRDGVINRDAGYVHLIEDFEFLPGAIDGLRRLYEAGYALVIVTNQSGIARGLYDLADFDRLTAYLLAELALSGIIVTDVYHCPHLRDAAIEAYRVDCCCRKPQPGMLLRAIAEHVIDPSASVMIGDKPSDIAAGLAAGVGRCFLITNGQRDRNSEAHADFTSLSACVDAILA